MITCPQCQGAGTIDVYQSRFGDPDTSTLNGNRHQFVTRFSTKSQRARLLWILAQQPMTAQEAAITLLGHKASVSQVESARRRISDLRKLGLIGDMDAYGQNERGGEALIWEVTKQGLYAIELLQTTGWSE